MTGLIVLGLLLSIAIVIGFVCGVGVGRWSNPTPVIDRRHRQAMHALAHGPGPRPCRRRQWRSTWPGDAA